MITKLVTGRTGSQEPDDLSAGDHPLRPHLDFVDGLRALAALYVLLFHAWATVFPHEAPTGLALALTGWLRYSRVGVDFFIVLSGFCLALPLVHGKGMDREGARRFFRRRARRILPPYYAALRVSLLLALTLLRNKTGTIWDTSLPVTFPGLLAHLFLIHDAFPGAVFSQIDYPLWTIAVECQVYLFFPLLALGWARFGVKETTAMALWVSLLLCYAISHVPLLSSLYGLTPIYLALFAFGMLGAAVCYQAGAEWTKLRERVPWEPLSAGLAVTLIALCNFWGHQGVFSRLLYVDLLVGVFALSVLVGAGRREGVALRSLLGQRPLAFLGAFSYSVYLLHAPILQLAWQFLLRPLHLRGTATFLLLAIVGAPLTVFGSFLFFLCFERPFVTARKGRSS